MRAECLLTKSRSFRNRIFSHLARLCRYPVRSGLFWLLPASVLPFVQKAAGQSETCPWTCEGSCLFILPIFASKPLLNGRDFSRRKSEGGPICLQKPAACALSEGDIVRRRQKNASLPLQEAFFLHFNGRGTTNNRRYSATAPARTSRTTPPLPSRPRSIGQPGGGFRRDRPDTDT